METRIVSLFEIFTFLLKVEPISNNHTVMWPMLERPPPIRSVPRETSWTCAGRPPSASQHTNVIWKKILKKWSQLDNQSPGTSQKKQKKTQISPPKKRGQVFWKRTDQVFKTKLFWKRQPPKNKKKHRKNYLAKKPSSSAPLEWGQS